MTSKVVKRSIDSSLDHDFKVSFPTMSYTMDDMYRFAKRSVQGKSFAIPLALKTISARHDTIFCEDTTSSILVIYQRVFIPSIVFHLLNYCNESKKLANFKILFFLSWIKMWMQIFVSILKLYYYISIHSVLKKWNIKITIENNSDYSEFYLAFY